MGTNGGALCIQATGSILVDPTTEHIQITGCTFENNLATTAGGALYVYNNNGSANLLIESSRFEGNVGFS